MTSVASFSACTLSRMARKLLPRQEVGQRVRRGVERGMGQVRKKRGTPAALQLDVKVARVEEHEHVAEGCPAGTRMMVSLGAQSSQPERELRLQNLACRQPLASQPCTPKGIEQAQHCPRIEHALVADETEIEVPPS